MTLDVDPSQGEVSSLAARATHRVALGVSYRGTPYKGWQSQRGGGTVQDALESALSAFATHKVSVVCAGRTDAGVHGINQVVHFDTALNREPFSWVRGTNAFLPRDIAVQWAVEVPTTFHARQSAQGRRYVYILLESAVRPALDSGHVGWVFRPLDQPAMGAAALHLIGQHDFSSFRSSQCQSPTPVKTLREIRISRGPSRSPPMAAALGVQGCYWRFDFEGNAFLHHMIRNIMGCLVTVGSGAQPPRWLEAVRDARDRNAAAPTFAAEGLYFVGPRYADEYGLPDSVPAMEWLPL